MGVMTSVNPRSRNLWPIEVSKLSGAGAHAIANWRHHEFLDGIGEFDKAANRWNYSLIDAIKLRIINDLATVGTRLPYAAAIAAIIDERVEELAAGKKPENQVIVAWVDGKELTRRRARIDQWLADYKQHSRPTTIVVPIDNIAAEIMAMRSLMRARREKRKVQDAAYA
jgi:hypothetical protein